MQISDDLKQAILQHAKHTAPHECCGFIVFKAGKLVYLPCKNIADDPERFFEISPDDWLKAQWSDGVVAVVHSHPDGVEGRGLPFLSTADREAQVRSGLDWWLVCQNQIYQFRNIPPLLGREFHNETQDCRTLCLDAYMLAGVDIDQGALHYEFNWFEQGDNLYEQHLILAGLEPLPDGKSEQLGDIILLQVGSPVANHAGIYLGDQMMLHHSVDRLSARVPYGGYWVEQTHSIWRYKQWQQLHFTAILNDLAMNQLF